MTTATRIRPIRNEDDFNAALARISEIFDPEPDTPEADEAEVLAILIQTYEREHYDWPRSEDPVATVQAYLDNRELKADFLIPFLGSEAIVTEFFERKRSLTVEMIRNLHVQLGIAAEDLLGA